jgi:hypothetical protein
MITKKTSTKASPANQENILATICVFLPLLFQCQVEKIEGIVNLG